MKPTPIMIRSKSSGGLSNPRATWSTLTKRGFSWGDGSICIQKQSGPPSSVVRIPKSKLPLKLRRNLRPLAKTSTWHSIGTVSPLCPQHCADCKRKLVLIYSPSPFPKDLKDAWKLLKRKPHLFIVILIYNIAIAVVTNIEEGPVGKQKGTPGVIAD